MKNIKLSKHALIRSQQRGITIDAISIILEYGHRTYLNNGAQSWSMSKQEKQYAKSDLGKSFFKIEKQLGFLVVANDVLLTVSHQTRRYRKH